MMHKLWHNKIQQMECYYSKSQLTFILTLHVYTHFCLYTLYIMWSYLQENFSEKMWSLEGKSMMFA